MPDVIKARCPGCKRDLRIRADWLRRAFRCKFCHTVIHAKRNDGNGAAVLPDPAPIPSTRAGKSKDAVADGPADSAGITTVSFAPADDAPIVQVNGRYRRSRNGRWIALAIVLIILVIGGVAAYNLWTPIAQQVASLREVMAPDQSKKTGQTPLKETNPAAGNVFPRRALAICVNNYLYANPVGYGSDDNDVGAFLDKLSSVLHIDPGQVVELSDAARLRLPKEKAARKGKASRATRVKAGPATEAPARPPLKSIIEKTVAEFLDGCRAQDRIIVLYAGHVAMIDDEPFLVPLEGEFSVKEGLIPMSWLFERLKKCPARQKVLLLDTCRLDLARGLERPGTGAMEEKLDELLARPPDGVQVWTACVKGQNSYEFDGGSLFLKQLMDALDPKVIKKIQHVEDPLPLDALAAVVNKSIETEIATQLKKKQTPRLVGREAADGAAYDKSQPLPAKIKVSGPAPPEGGIARAEDVRSILDEIELPPIKLAREETARLQIESLVPFAAKKLDDYRADYGSIKEIEANADKFPLRVAALNAIKLIREKFDPRNAAITLRDNFAGTTNDKVKAEILKEQAKPAELLLELQETRGMLEKAGENRENESSKRWQAHYDFVLAQLLARIAYVEEYSLMLGKIRKDELPELEEGQTGFQLASRDKLGGTKEFKDMAAESKSILKKLAKEHKGTPWEILARREQLTALGLQWQATR